MPTVTHSPMTNRGTCVQLSKQPSLKSEGWPLTICQVVPMICFREVIGGVMIKKNIEDDRNL